MNYYPHHIGDFNNSTRHLTRVERSVYRDAIEMYYDTESPLSLDIDMLARKLICVSEHEREALLCVLDEFFVLTDDGYAHERCDAEIAKYRANTSAKARAGKASAAKRKQNSTRVKQTLNTRTTDEQLTKNQEPITKNQEPIKNIMSGKPDPAKDILEYLNQKTGKAFKAVQSNLKLINARLKEGHTEVDMRAVIDRKCIEWPDGAKMHEYLRPATLFNAEKFNQYVGDIGKPIIYRSQGNAENLGNRKLSLGERATEHRKRAERIIAKQEADDKSMGEDDAHIRPPLDIGIR